MTYNTIQYNTVIYNALKVEDRIWGTYTLAFINDGDRRPAFTR